jgi:hypothetical protein
VVVAPPSPPSFCQFPPSSQPRKLCCPDGFSNLYSLCHCLCPCVCVCVARALSPELFLCLCGAVSALTNPKKASSTLADAADELSSAAASFANANANPNPNPNPKPNPNPNPN